ncbi:L,D-transpeptidase family protein [Peribacillus alkalitolerans]|uniref:L,D-transpeptidase family protein n=1 Tax=Peribacillus alkalitolerans TaxID=1550385 RepID=UPI001F08263F|nr:L,D-transpeptidase family protein [Peribacillus alkalitolerans]
MKRKFIIIFTLVFTFVISLGNTTSAATPISDPNLRNALSKVRDTGQVIIVKAKPYSRTATVQGFEKINGQWMASFQPIPAVIGKNGIGKTTEGDGKTPVGAYQIGSTFGWAKSPTNMKMPYKQTNKFHYWVDDTTSRDYNKWMYYTGNPYSRWKSFERLNHPLYKYAFVIRFNNQPIVNGKGSAIFFHVWNGPTTYTAGCVAVSEKHVVNILRWLDAKKKPIIVIGDPNLINSSIINY